MLFDSVDTQDIVHILERLRYQHRCSILEMVTIYWKLKQRNLFDNHKMSQGLPVVSVHVCGGTGTDGKINWINIVYSGCHSSEQGQRSGTCKSLYIDVEGGERITEIEMRGPEDGQWLARLRIKTNRGGDLLISKNYCGGFFGQCNYADKRVRKGDELGEGIILGISGKHEHGHIRCLRFRLLEKITDSELTDVEITNLPQVQLEDVASVTKENPTETDQVIACSGREYTKLHRKESSWSYTDDHLHSVTVSVKYQSPKLYSVPKGTVTGEVTGQYQYIQF